MDNVLSETRIAINLAQELTSSLVMRVIRGLQCTAESGLLSGDDSGLKNTWDEICVQVQEEESQFWDTYLEEIDTQIGWRLARLKPYELDALWLQTREGLDWQSESLIMREPEPVIINDIVEYLQGRVLAKAMNWTNRRVTKYLERQLDW